MQPGVSQDDPALQPLQDRLLGAWRDGAGSNIIANCAKSPERARKAGLVIISKP